MKRGEPITPQLFYLALDVVLGAATIIFIPRQHVLVQAIFVRALGWYRWLNLASSSTRIGHIALSIIELVCVIEDHPLT